MKKEYIPDPIEVNDIELPNGINETIEVIAKNAHEVWSKMRLEKGWVYGKERNDFLKTSPCLVPYEDLPECEKAYDRNMAIQIIKLLIKLGYKVEK